MGLKIIARILHDLASNKSFIRSDLEKTLNAKILQKEKKHFIYTILKKLRKSKFKKVEFFIRSLLMLFIITLQIVSVLFLFNYGLRKYVISFK